MVLFNPQQGDKGSHTFPKGISLKGNVIARLEFEIVYFEAKVHGDSPEPNCKNVLVLYFYHRNQVTTSSLTQFFREPLTFHYTNLTYQRFKLIRNCSYKMLAKPNTKASNQKSKLILISTVKLEYLPPIK